jgi:SAM-dependent methyltransferase
MQNTSGARKLLSFAFLYESFQYIVGARRARGWIAEHLWKCPERARVVDMGCGPGSTLEYLPPNVHYAGYDISSEYIRSASEKYQGRPDTFFHIATARTLLEAPNPRFENADLLICKGLLHHLDEKEVLETLELAQMLMAPEGRLVIVEPTFLVHQSALSRLIMNQDRGLYIRTEALWKQLVGSVFESFSTSIATSLTRIPYVHIFIECRSKTTTL